MKTRRQFFDTLFRSVATAAALCYAPSVLAKPKFKPGKWSWAHTVRIVPMEVGETIPAGTLCSIDRDGYVVPYGPKSDVFMGVSDGNGVLVSSSGEITLEAKP